MNARQVLVIDDDDDIRAIVAMSLEAVGGYVVRTAASGSAGIASAIADPPDAILLDVMMPEMDGPTTFRKLQEIGSTHTIPVVLLTAKQPIGGDDMFADLGVCGVISKPFDVMGLPGLVAETLGWQR